MSSNADFDNRLIELVRANPSVYQQDVRNSPYESLKKKKELWCSIATSLKTDVGTCMIRWNYLRDRLHRELLKDQSDWSLLEKLRFVGQKKHSYSERSLQQTASSPPAVINVIWRSGQVIANDENDALQEAMEVIVPTVSAPAPTLAPSTASGTTPSNDEIIKRIEAMLQGLGTNRSMAEKKIVAYLCKCTLRTLNDEQIDDIFI